MDALIARLDPAIGVLVLALLSAVGALWRVLLSLLKDAREDRERYLLAMAAHTEALERLKAEVSLLTTHVIGRARRNGTRMAE